MSKKLWIAHTNFTFMTPTWLHGTCSWPLFYLLCFLSHAIRHKWKKKRKKNNSTICVFFIWGMSPNEKIICIFCSNVKFNSVFNRCTNCLANSVLYSCDHNRGLSCTVYLTHWTIICFKRLKRKFYREVRTLVVLGNSQVGLGDIFTFNWKRTAWKI